MYDSSVHLFYLASFIWLSISQQRGHLYSGLHQHKCDQQLKRGESPSGVLHPAHPALGSSAQERHGSFGAHPEEAHEDNHRITERFGLEKALKSSSSLVISRKIQELFKNRQARSVVYILKQDYILILVMSPL